jgi:hypothetical protein
VGLEVNSKNSTIGSIFLWLITPEEAFIGPTIKLELEDEHEDRSSARTRTRWPRSSPERPRSTRSWHGFGVLSEDHFGYAPDKVTWAHVGTLGRYADLLKRITDMAFNDSEHAA